MPTLHDPRARAEIAERVRALRPDSPRRWGKMTVDQMVWHVNQGLLQALGQLQCAPKAMPLPAFLMKPLVFTLPWPRGAPTFPEFEAVSQHDFAQEKERCLKLVGDFGQRELQGSWPTHMSFGPLRGDEWSRLMYKHMDHHLRQFSA